MLTLTELSSPNCCAILGSQLEKNYGKEGAEIIVDNTQLTIFGGFAPQSTSAETLSKALGSRTVMSGSVSRSKNDPSESLQMIERPLMTPDELKSMPKGQFVVMKTGFYPMKVKLKLFFKWGIHFDEEHPYTVSDQGNREVKYASKKDITDGIINKKKELKHNGKVYVFSPFALIWNDDSYYVIGYSDSHQKITKFRIDRIYGMKISEKFAVRKPEDFKVSDYFSQVFSMYEGTESEITLLCENELMTYVIDRFGESVPVTPADEDHFSATVKVSLSQTFYGWVFSFGGRMKIQAPQEAVDGFQNLLQKFQ